MNYFEVVKYDDSLYQIKDKLGVLSTLIIGEKKAILFDTGYGIGDLNSEVRKITDKELIVICSHGHMDHTGGNYQFDEVYIDELDYNLCLSHNNTNRRQRNINSLNRICPNFISENNFDVNKYLSLGAGNLKVLDKDYFDIGEDVNVIRLEGHTQGSIGLYLPKRKLLLVSDAICPFVWLFLKESLSLVKYIKMVERTLKLDFDNFLVGHGARLFPKSKMFDFLNVAKSVDLDRSVKVSFENFDDLNPHCFTFGKMYDQNDCGVVFDPNKIIDSYYDQHMHSSFSADSQEDLANYIECARRDNVDFICTCEHFDYLTVVDGTTWIADYPKLIEYHKELKEQNPDIDFLLGIELGYKRICFDEMVELSNKYPFDIIQLSIHDNNKWDYYFKDAFLGHEVESMNEYFDLMYEAMERFSNFDVLSHIDFGFKTLKMIDKKWEINRWDSQIRKIMTKLIEMDKAFEVNTKVQEVIYDIDKDNHHIEYLLSLYKELGGHKVTLSSDAHIINKYRSLFGKYMGMLKEFGFNELSFYIKRKEFKYIIK